MDESIAIRNELRRRADIRLRRRDSNGRFARAPVDATIGDAFYSEPPSGFLPWGDPARGFWYQRIPPDSVIPVPAEGAAGVWSPERGHDSFTCHAGDVLGIYFDPNTGKVTSVIKIEPEFEAEALQRWDDDGGR